MKELSILRMLKQELPKTMGDVNFQLLYSDICDALDEGVKEITELRAEMERLTKENHQLYHLHDDQMEMIKHRDKEIGRLQGEYKRGMLDAANYLRTLYTSGNISHHPSTYYARLIEAKMEDL